MNSNCSNCNPKTVIISGGNNGIGLYMTETLLRDGYKVAVFDLSSDNLQLFQEELKGSMLFCKCDIRSDMDIKNSVETVIKQWGHIDILVNNACIAIFKDFEEKTIEETKEEFEVNYFGNYRLIKAVLPYMKQQGGGIIHNLSSGIGTSGFPRMCGYTSTKGAIEALVKTLKIELSKYNIEINIMHPPLTNTKSARPLGVPVEVMADPKEVGRKLAKKITSTKKIITPDFQTAFFTFLTYRYPYKIGNLLSKMTEKALKDSKQK